MGKKRRLKSARVKFAAKHSHHPRAQFLAQKELKKSEPEIIEEIKVAEKPQEVEKATAEVTLAKEEPKHVPKVKVAPPKAKKAATPRKRKATTPRKRTTKKKTTSAVA